MNKYLNQIILGDCQEIMRTMPDNCVDAIVTDPPYGLSKEPDITAVLKHWLNSEDYTHNGNGFMGKEWDSFVPNPSVWKEAYRVLKPGGYLLSFAGTRTVDLLGISLRLAGFKMHPIIAWVFGEGFPKSVNLSKQFDKQAGITRKVIGYSERNDRKLPNGEGGTHGTLHDKYVADERESVKLPITKSATPEAQQWDGWYYGKQSLKPALEPICMVQKPIDCKRMTDNVKKWGVGAINIDGCRIGTEILNNPQKDTTAWHGNNWSAKPQKSNGEIKTVQCRFPANIIFDEEAGRLLDEQSGNRPSGKGNGNAQVGEESNGAIKPLRRGNLISRNDSGGASRFFKNIQYTELDYLPFYYCAKASKAERGRGNNHPTVKPVELMRYLIRLVTPPEGIVLDPFAGSGSTLVAAKLEDFNYIGIEQLPEIHHIAQYRVSQVMVQPKLFEGIL